MTDVTDEIKEQEREETKEVIDAFLTRESRNSFIVRVYSILTVQLVLVALSVLAFGRYPSLSYWMMTRGKIGEYYVYLNVYCVCMYVVVCMWFGEGEKYPVLYVISYMQMILQTKASTVPTCSILQCNTVPVLCTRNISSKSLCY